MLIDSRRGIHLNDPNIRISMRCPACRNLGMFEMKHSSAQDLSLHTSKDKHFRLGQRICPNEKCQTHVFVILSAKNELVTSYPPETIDFESHDIPHEVVTVFDEAIRCQANHCFRAAAMMIRKTLEVLCDQQNAGGENLKERVASLGAGSIVPPDLMKGVDHLRLIGNDAAHVESKNYDQIGKKEVDAALKFTRELLRAVFQYGALTAELESLKAT